MTHGNFIGGEWRTPEKSRPDVNPADITDVIGAFTESGTAEMDEAVATAAGAGPGWRRLGPIRRAEFLRRAGELLVERADTMARAITREQGKLLREARGEVDRTLAILRFTEGEARRLNGVTTPAEDQRTLAYTFRVPIGVTGLITPWNFPLAIPMWKVAPALLSGCTAVLKPSPLTPYTAALLTQLFADAGLPPGVLNLVQGDREAGEALVAHEAVAGVSFTGSLPVGRAIHQAGAARLLKTQLELGGKNAVLVLDDADLPKAAEAVAAGAFGQAGQRCSATSRVIADVRIKDPLLALLTERVAAMKVGPGTDPDADICPVVSEDRMDACLAAVDGAVGAGAKIAAGGGRVAELPGGYFLRPTVLQDVPRHSEIAREEIFGPVLSVIDCDGFDDALAVANDVRYGMSGTIFTRNMAHAFEALERLDAGMLHVNRPGVGAYAHLPHVGAKLSQYGAPECSPQVWDFYTDWRSACISY